MNIDVVFSGGGVKAYAFMGALQSIEEHNLHIERAAGTSAGSIIAAFTVASIQTQEIYKLFYELNLQQFLDAPKLSKLIPLGKWPLLYYQMGLYRGDQFEKWVHDQLATKGVYTFGDLKLGYLKIVVSDLLLGKLVVLPDDLERLYGIEPNAFPISKAIRMSASFPYIFMPKKITVKTNRQSIIVDGGLLSNFPLWVFNSDANKNIRPTLGVKLSGPTQIRKPREIKNALDMFQALFAAMKQAHDDRFVSTEHKSNIIYIPVDGVDPIDLSINKTTKDHLINRGKDHSNAFLKYWPK